MWAAAVAVYGPSRTTNGGQGTTTFSGASSLTTICFPAASFTSAFALVTTTPVVSPLNVCPKAPAAFVAPVETDAMELWTGLS